jgi:cyclic-di-GMP-binding biofilm dispersal mediator protein
MNDQSGKVFLVVGATGALGSRIAKQLAGCGAKLTISGRSEDALAALGVDGAHACGCSAPPCPCSRKAG